MTESRFRPKASTRATWFMVMVTCAVGLFAALFGAEAQQAGKVWQIGLFHVGLDHVPPHLDGLREGLQELGYVQGKNVRLDWRNLADEDAARTAAHAFVRNRVDLIVAFENQTARAGKAATSEIPIVFVGTADPVAEGLVKTFPRPGGNATGFTVFTELPGKQLELFKELVQRLRRVLVLIDPDDQSRQQLLQLREAAATLKLTLVEREARDRGDIERIFGSVKPGDVDGVFVGSLSLQTKFTSVILRLASEKRLPLRTQRKEWVEQGALFSYGPNYRAVGRDVARLVDKILKGAKPADLPVEQPMRLELVINVRAAKALGLAIPPSVLARADEVIQ